MTPDSDPGSDALPKPGHIHEDTVFALLSMLIGGGFIGMGLGLLVAGIQWNQSLPVMGIIINIGFGIAAILAGGIRLPDERSIVSRHLEVTRGAE